MKNIIVILPFVLIILFCSENPTDPKNNPPTISAIFAISDTVKESDSSAVVCIATDEDGDELTYTWSVEAGSIQGVGDSVIWVAPNSVGTYIVQCEVSDGNGGQAVDSISLEVIQRIPTGGLIAYWPFNGNANDESGNNHNGTVQGASLTYDRFGIENKAYHFDGNDYISVPDDTSFTLATKPFALSLWISLDQIGSYYIMGHDEGGGYTRKWIFWFTGSALGLHERLNGDYWVINSSWNPETNIWYFVNLIREQNTFRIYVDANLIGSKEDSRSIPDPRTSLIIGNAEESGRMFRGNIDDVRFYSRALTEEEINLLYSEGGWSN